MALILFLTDLMQNFEFVTAFAIMMKITDRRISGIHVTVLAAMYNFGEFMHKFYIFKLVDAFGIFYPQAVMATFALLTWLLMRGKFLALNDKPMSAWHISDSVLQKSTKTTN